MAAVVKTLIAATRWANGLGETSNANDTACFAKKGTTHT